MKPQPFVTTSPTEGICWVRLNLSRYRSLRITETPGAIEAVLTSARSTNRRKLEIFFSEGFWFAAIVDPHRPDSYRHNPTIVTLPRWREDRIKVLAAIAREYLK